MAYLFGNDHYSEGFKSIMLTDGTELLFRVLESAAGFYIGTWHDEPYSRESEQYWATREEAQRALDTGKWLLKI